MGKVTESLSETLGIGYDIAAGGFKCTMTEAGALVEGICGILKFTPESVMLKLKRRRAEIEGAGLCIRELSRGYMLIGGEITSVKIV